MLAVPSPASILTLPALWKVQHRHRADGTPSTRSPRSSPSCRSVCSASTSPSPSRSSTGGRWATPSSRAPGTWATSGSGWRRSRSPRSSSPRSTSSCRSTRQAPPAFMRGFLGSPSTEEVPFDWKFVNYAPDRPRRHLPRAVDRLAPLGQEVVHRSEAHRRPPRGRLVRRGDRARAPRRGLPAPASTRHTTTSSSDLMTGARHDEGRRQPCAVGCRPPPRRRPGGHRRPSTCRSPRGCAPASAAASSPPATGSRASATSPSVSASAG